MYFFNCAPKSLSGAFDRFSRFFIDPMFDGSCTEREIEAVHSEHTKNMQSDQWRLQQLMKGQCHKDHPLSKFATGNRETLKTYPEGEGLDMREILLDFHKKWYSSNIMSMSIFTQ